jgi:hypothetical protein
LFICCEKAFLTMCPTSIMSGSCLINSSTFLSVSSVSYLIQGVCRIQWCGPGSLGSHKAGTWMHYLSVPHL